MSTEGITFKNLTDEQRDNAAKLIELGLKQAEVAKILGVGKTSISNLCIALKNVREENWDELRAMNGKKLGKTTEWALKHEGKEMPPEPKPESKEIPKIVLPIKTEPNTDMAQIKQIVTEAITENCKDARIEQIDKDQMGRVMYALARIDERLEALETKFEAIQAEQNANADKLYKLVVDFRNSVVMEMRKRR